VTAPRAWLIWTIGIFAYLVAVSQLPDATVQSAVEASVLHQLLEQDPRVARSYRFRHALTREAIYDDMILPHRERLHAREVG